MTWTTTGNQPTNTTSTLDTGAQLSIAQRDLLIMQWKEAKTNLKVAQNLELQLREQVKNAAFANPKKGTNTLELGGGYKLKLVEKINYTVDHDRASEIQDNIETLSEKGKVLSDRFFSWSARLSEREYNALDPLKPEDKAILDELNKVITSSPATPALELIEPAAS